MTVPEFDIDLPVVSSQLEVAGNPPRYPLCDVAQYLTSFSQPGQGGTIYIYGHAREGMLLRLLQESLQENGAALLGARVEVESSDGWTHFYEVDLVKRHAVDFSIAEDLSPGEEQVVLQTSEGPSGTVPKLQVGARLVERTPTPADRLPPRAEPRVCA
ncbi:MAG: sortase [Chloroflexota bacterium]|nr:sortase [Chloroflexota bacterium]